MESKVLMFNSDDIKVGETYMRRARQLVSQQRAEWTDESRSAIRFAPDGELLPETAAEESRVKTSLYALAEKRIRERKRFWLYTAGLCVFVFCDFMIIGEEMYAWEFASFLFGVVFTLWVQHARSYAKAYVRGFRVPDREERRARNLHMEMEKLKRMGYVE